MPANPYTKGSRWRRWDLHIHTPGTKKNDQFTGSSIEDKWTTYINDINAYPGEISAIGITDYTCVENYFKFKGFVADGTITKQIPLIIPNIELRILPATGSATPINIHCLFNPSFDDKIKERFLHRLKFDYRSRLYSASKTDLIDLGKSYKNDQSLSDDVAVEEAIKQYTVSVTDLRILFKDDPELRTNLLIVVANSSKDGASGLKDHCELIEGQQFATLDATRQAIYQFSEAIFSGSDKDVKYFAGLGADPVQEVKRKCLGLMPCYHGSDAHDNAKIFKPDLKRYCWIKSDPTFNGLRQTLYEPTSRVRIQEDHPEVKKDYLIIDEVKFVPAPGDTTFSPDAIDTNDKLNAIIGGKSSGKSLLLYYIAKTIDPEQVRKKLEELGVDAGYNFDNNPLFDFEVKWGDGTIYKLRQAAGEKSRQITYIPQMYINFLAEKRGKEGLKSLIESFLEEKETFSSFLKELQKEQDAAKVELNTAITQFFQLKGNHNRIAEEIRGKGDKSARLRNIDEKNAELAGLRAVAGFTEEDEQKFEQLEKNRKIHQDRLTSLQQLKAVYQTEYPAELEKLRTSIEGSLDNYSRLTSAKFMLHPFIGRRFPLQVNADKEQVNAVFKQIIERAQKFDQKIDRLIVLTNGKINQYNTGIQPYLDKISNRSKLQSLQQEIAAEQSIVDQINELELSLTATNTAITQEYDKINAAYSRLLDSYNKIVAEINGKPEYSEISTEKKIKLKAYLDFDTQRFGGACTTFINKQSYFSNIFGTYFDGSNNYIFEKDTHAGNFKDIFDKILEPSLNNIRFNQGGTTQNITTSLFDDYFSVNYELSQDGEDILRMSPGKKGMILLFLILHLSNADYPILIDQPEDNLDNRTVYTELKDFIKQKKIERQIIIVTHNANIVVPTDAENVIVANQEGQDAGKDNAAYRFEYISGSLENTYRSAGTPGILNQMGIKEHVCEILEGGEAAFIEREKRYSLNE
jgi:hypothetical protein